MERNTLVDLAFKRIAEVGWEAFSLKDLMGSGACLQDIAQTFGDKPAVLDAFAQMINETLAATHFAFMPQDTPLDRLFEVVMARLDVLAPYKHACASIFASFEVRPLEGAVFLYTLRKDASHMLDLACVSSPPLFFASAFGGFYGLLLTTWARDTDPHMEETMAFCHKGLGKLCDLFPLTLKA